MAGNRRKKPRFDDRMQLRMKVFLGVIMAMLLALVGVLYYIAEVKGDDYSIRVLNQNQYSSTTLPFKRGDILDANGNILATSVKVYNVIIDSYIILSDEDYMAPTVEALAACFGLDAAELQTEIESRSTSRYWSRTDLRKLSYDDISDFLAMQDADSDIQGVWFEESYERKYPYTTLASNTIGFASSSNTAEMGLEGYYNDTLNGTDGRSYGYMNQDNVQESVTIDPIDGCSITTTLDLNIQNIVETKIAEWVELYNPKNVAVIIMDPNTGEVLAMAQNNNYDPNNPEDLSGYYTEEEIEELTREENVEEKYTALYSIWQNYCVTATYEPGSTAKVLTIASALEEGMVTADSTFECDGGEQVANYYIRCTSHHGTITLTEALMYSCNDALMCIGDLLGATLFSDYQLRFNLGMKTGIDLTYEDAGLTYDVENIDSTTLATNSFGQNFNVTMIQMASAFCSCINGGYYWQPHLVSKITNADGNVVSTIEKTLVKRTVTEETSEFLRQALEQVVENGTGKYAAVEGYSVGGKTGTAQKQDKEASTYVLSFIGMAPVDDPQVVCYVVVDEPDVENNDSSSYASRLWSNIMTEVLPYLNIYE
ncbi:MAG: penicillin-binding protein 2 [Lachnospiraceae bacterium]|nr:penicillin-binding protein 2 [Lachnospiraceae bacterium]